MSQTVVKKSRKPSAAPRSADQPQVDCSAKPAVKQKIKLISQGVVDKAIAAENRIKGVHPACAALPLIDKECFNQLCASIDAHDQLEAIRIDSDGLLLDGRCRLAACHKLGVAARIEESNDDPWAIAQSNVARRHLTTGQRAITATKLLDGEQAAAKARKSVGLKKGTKGPECRNSGARGRADAIVAMQVGVSPDSIAKAKRLPADLKAEVMSGSQSLHAASKIAAARAGKAIPKKPKPAKSREAKPGSDGIRTEYQHHGMMVYSHCGCDAVGVVIRRGDGKWLGFATNSPNSTSNRSAEEPEAWVRKHLLEAAEASKQATSELAGKVNRDS